MTTSIDPLVTKLPPGSRAPALIQGLRYLLRPYAFAAGNAKRFGDRFTIRIAGLPPIVVFSDPDAIRDIFTADPDVLYGGEATAWLMEPIFGSNSLVVLDGIRHRRERRLLAPPFHGDRIHHYSRTMQAIADEVIDSWPVGRPFPIYRQMQAIALEVILQTVFGLERVARLSPLRDSLIGLLKLAESRVVGLVLVPALRVDLGPRSPWGRLLRARAEVARLLIAEVDHLRKVGTGGRNDILAMLVDARDDNGEALGDDELFEQMFTLLPTGYQTTATSLAWVFHHLLRHPEVQDKLRAERQRVAGDGPITHEHLGALPYLDAVIRESARLTPITTDVLRLLKKPARIGGLDLPAGVMVSGSIYLTHHRPELWPDPARFHPERFLNVRPSPHSYFPFGGGERRCIGAALAGHEMKIVLARVLSRADLRLATGRRERPMFQTITIAPSQGVPVVMDRPPRPR